MEKYVNCLDLYEVYEEANKMLFSALAKIEPANEYEPFIEQNKRLAQIRMNSVLLVASKYPVS